MTEINEKLKEISEKINEHIMAVTGTMELVDASVSEDDLHNLLLKAIERMENLQVLSDEMFAVLTQLFEKMNEAKRKEAQ